MDRVDANLRKAIGEFPKSQEPIERFLEFNSILQQINNPSKPDQKQGVCTMFHDHFIGRKNRKKGARPRFDAKYATKIIEHIDRMGELLQRTLQAIRMYSTRGISMAKPEKIKYLKILSDNAKFRSDQLAIIDKILGQIQIALLSCEGDKKQDFEKLKGELEGARDKLGELSDIEGQIGSTLKFTQKSPAKKGGLKTPYGSNTQLSAIKKANERSKSVNSPKPVLVKNLALKTVDHSRDFDFGKAATDFGKKAENFSNQALRISLAIGGTALFMLSGGALDVKPH